MGSEPQLYRSVHAMEGRVWCEEGCGGSGGSRHLGVGRDVPGLPCPHLSLLSFLWADGPIRSQEMGRVCRCAVLTLLQSLPVPE